MKPKFFFLLTGTIFLLAACNDKTSKWRVKTQYHVNKFKEGDSVYTGDGIAHTLLFILRTANLPSTLYLMATGWNL